MARLGRKHLRCRSCATPHSLASNDSPFSPEKTSRPPGQTSPSSAPAESRGQAARPSPRAGSVPRRWPGSRADAAPSTRTAAGHWEPVSRPALGGQDVEGGAFAGTKPSMTCAPASTRPSASKGPSRFKSREAVDTTRSRGACFNRERAQRKFQRDQACRATRGYYPAVLEIDASLRHLPRRIAKMLNHGSRL